MAVRSLLRWNSKVPNPGAVAFHQPGPVVLGSVAFPNRSNRPNPARTETSVPTITRLNTSPTRSAVPPGRRRMAGGAGTNRDCCGRGVVSSVGRAAPQDGQNGSWPAERAPQDGHGTSIIEASP